MKTYSISSVVRIATLFSFSGVAMLSPVNAQEQKASNRLLEEVAVTAQKREERIEDVPISLQVFSQEKMEALGISSVQDIQLATPGFTVTSASGFNITFLRGVGSDAFLPGVDTSLSLPIIVRERKWGRIWGE